MKLIHGFPGVFVLWAGPGRLSVQATLAAASTSTDVFYFRPVGLLPLGSRLLVALDGPALRFLPCPLQTPKEQPPSAGPPIMYPEALFDQIGDSAQSPKVRDISSLLGANDQQLAQLCRLPSRQPGRAPRDRFRAQFHKRSLPFRRVWRHIPCGRSVSP